jgi:hypothetical protein
VPKHSKTHLLSQACIKTQLKASLWFWYLPDQLCAEYIGHTVGSVGGLDWMGAALGDHSVIIGSHLLLFWTRFGDALVEVFFLG